MPEKVNYNPDILSCLANLSSDEVFTPPEIANSMLDMLPTELFESPDTKFLDPGCKSGVFLREIAKRLNEGLKDKIPDVEQRMEHIMKKQLFAIAITQITGFLSRRSVYCSKDASSRFSVVKFDNSDGNIRYRRIEHKWDGIGKKDDQKCVLCGAPRKEFDRGDELETHAYEFIHMDKKTEKEMRDMKFDVIIGNPPYQLADGGAQASAMPIYNLFVSQAKKLNPRYLTMIIPARWYAGGKNLENFREEMLKDTHIRQLHDFQDASDCFSGVEIKGGICYFLRDRDNPGLCKVVSHEGTDISSIMERKMCEEGCDSFIRYNKAISILHKVRSYKEKNFSTNVHSAMTFGFRTFFKDFDSDSYKPGMVKVYANHSQGYVNRNRVNSGQNFIDKWKVFIPEAVGSGDMRQDKLKPIIGEPSSISTETYIMNGPYDSKETANNVVSYINTKFFHFMLGLKKITQHTTAKAYMLIPIQDFSKSWTDQELYKKYGLTDDEIAFIESMIKPMDLGGADA